MIENRHNGIPTMKREMKKHGLAEPKFYEERDSFKVVFRNNNIILEKESDSQSGQQINQVSEQVLSYRKRIIEYCIKPRSAKQIRECLSIK